MCNPQLYVSAYIYIDRWWRQYCAYLIQVCIYLNIERRLYIIYITVSLSTHKTSRKQTIYTYVYIYIYTRLAWKQNGASGSPPGCPQELHRELMGAPQEPHKSPETSLELRRKTHPSRGCHSADSQQNHNTCYLLVCIWGPQDITGLTRAI